MTNQSIAYANFVEAQRHNLAMESQEKANYLWRKNIEQSQYMESNRANLAKEAENQRHNLAEEYISKEQNRITENRNIANVMLNYRQLDESKRHNIRTEGLSERGQDWKEYTDGRYIYLEAQKTDAQKELWGSQRDLNVSQTSLLPFEAMSRRISANASAQSAKAALKNAATNYQGMQNTAWYQTEQINSLNWKQQEEERDRDFDLANKYLVEWEELDRKYPIQWAGVGAKILAPIIGLLK